MARYSHNSYSSSNGTESYSKAVLPENVKTLEMAYNHETSDVSGDFRPLEFTLVRLIQMMKLPRGFKRIRTYQKPKGSQETCPSISRDVCKG